MGKKINQLTPATDEEVVNAVMLWAIADPVTGLAKSATNSQVRKAVGVLKIKHTANGAEGRTIRRDELLNKDILFVVREGALMLEVDSNPDSLEFSFDGIDITLGLDVDAGQRFFIFYKYA